MGTFTSAMACSPLRVCGYRGSALRPSWNGKHREASLLAGPVGGFGNPPRVPILNVFERLQHFGDEVFSDLDEAGVFRLLQGVDHLSVGTLQVAFDHVVLEVIDGLRLVLHAVVATRGRSLGISSEDAARGNPDESEKSHSDDELHVASPYGESYRVCSDNRQAPQFPKSYTDGRILAPRPDAAPRRYFL